MIQVAPGLDLPGRLRAMSPRNAAFWSSFGAPHQVIAGDAMRLHLLPRDQRRPGGPRQGRRLRLAVQREGAAARRLVPQQGSEPWRLSRQQGVGPTAIQPRLEALRS